MMYVADKFIFHLFHNNIFPHHLCGLDILDPNSTEPQENQSAIISHNDTDINSIQDNGQPHDDLQPHNDDLQPHDDDPTTDDPINQSGSTVSSSLVVCNLCDDFFKTAMHLFQHLIAQHITLSPHRCSRCTFSCTQRSQLSAHVEEEHGFKLQRNHR